MIVTGVLLSDEQLPKLNRMNSFLGLNSGPYAVAGESWFDSPAVPYLRGAIRSFAAIATRNLTAVFAFVLIDSPVCGLRPIRAARSH